MCMKRLIGIALGCMFAVTSNAAGLVQVLDNEATDVLYYVDLDTVAYSKNQVLGGVNGEEYITAVMKTDALPNSDLRKQQGINIISEKWIMSCNDNSYYKLASSTYDANGRLIGSARLGDDVPLKTAFTQTTATDDMSQANRTAISIACNYHESKKKPIVQFKR